MRWPRRASVALLLNMGSAHSAHFDVQQVLVAVNNDTETSELRPGSGGASGTCDEQPGDGCNGEQCGR